jgi:hypothetical protein
VAKQGGGSLQPTSVTRNAGSEPIVSVTFNVHPTSSGLFVFFISMLDVLILVDCSHERSIVHIGIENHSVDPHEHPDSKKFCNEHKYWSGYDGRPLIDLLNSISFCLIALAAGCHATKLKPE